MQEKTKDTLILFTPAIIVDIIFFIIIPFLFIPSELWRKNPAKAVEDFLVLMYTTGMVLWPIIQIIFGLYAHKTLRKIGYSAEEIFGFSKFKERILGYMIIIVILIGITELLFFLEALINMIIFSMTYEEYWKQFARVLVRIPYWLRLFTWLVAPFTASICEELFYRAYGINMLEKHGVSEKKAVLIQAVAFGLWHGISVHTLITGIIGLIFGFIYVSDKRKTLMPLIIAHWIIDFLGFMIYVFV